MAFHFCVDCRSFRYENENRDSQCPEYDLGMTSMAAVMTVSLCVQLLLFFTVGCKATAGNRCSA